MRGASFSPAEICAIFGISKSTLFRYERDALLPAVPRDDTDERRYGSDHIRALAKRRLRDLFEVATKTDDEEKVRRATELQIVFGLLTEDDVDGRLAQLEEIDRVSAEAFKILLRIVLPRYELQDPCLPRLLGMLERHARNLAAKGEGHE